MTTNDEGRGWVLNGRNINDVVIDDPIYRPNNSGPTLYSGVLTVDVLACRRFGVDLWRHSYPRGMNVHVANVD